MKHVRAHVLLAAWAAAALACSSLGAPAATPVPTLPAPVRWQTPISGTAFEGNPAIAGGLVFVPVSHKPAPGSD